MRKRFNITGLCVPEKHYMVDLSSRLNEIRELIDEGAYFTINRARQYGKTTTLNALARALANDYFVVRLDFQSLGSASYKDENTFSLAFASCFSRGASLFDEDAARKNSALQKLSAAEETGGPEFDLRRLFRLLLQFCSASSKPVVLMIDEADSASNNQVFLDFLAQLRNYYLEREAVGTVTFRSVILAGVYDVRNLRRKIRQDEEHKMNSPWNIAAKFKVNMSFTSSDIEGMLKDYERDCHTGMDMKEIAELIFEDTSGYPYLVSAFCKLLDEEVGVKDGHGNSRYAWSREGFLEAERILLTEKNTLFDSLMGKLEEYPELNHVLKTLLFTGADIAYNGDEPAFDMAAMLGFLRNQNGMVRVANRIFETRLYNYYLSASDMQNMDLYKASQRDKNQFIIGGHLNMRRVLEKFTEHFQELYGDRRETFVEDAGRRFFLLYLRPIINGTGNYYVEAQTRNLRRTDVIVDYCGEQYIVEMKIWHGNEYNSRGERQLVQYLDDYHKNKGYMLSFDFNKNKKTGVREIVIGEKVIIEAVV